MSRTDKEGVNIRESVIGEANTYQMRAQILAGTIALTAKDPPLQFLDPNGAARIVNMPSNSVKGMYFIICNTAAGAFALTVNDSTGAVLIASVTQGKSAVVVSSGSGATSAWRSVISS